MACVRIVHWKAQEAGPLIEACRACGLEVEFDDVNGALIIKLIRRKPPDVLAIDLTRLPSHGREVAIYLRRTKYARHIPLIFVDGDPEKVEAIRRELPDATFTTRRQLCAGIKSAFSKRVADPVLPPGVMERYGSRTAQKLGIGEGSNVAVIDPPRDYAAALGVLPAEVEFVEFAELAELDDTPHTVHAITLWFIRDLRSYQAGLRRMRSIAGRTRLWIVWRKGVGTGLTDNLIRKAANEAGLVDYKICAVNEQWSAMAFARRKS